MHSTILTSPPRHDFVQVDGVDGRVIIDHLEFFNESISVEMPGELGANGNLPSVAAVPVQVCPLCTRKAPDLVLKCHAKDTSGR